MESLFGPILLAIGLAFILNSFVRQTEAGPEESATAEPEPDTSEEETVEENQEPPSPPNNVLLVADSHDTFSEDEVTITHSGKSFYLGFPDKYKTRLSNEVSFEEDLFFDEFTRLGDLEAKTGIENLPELIEKHRQVAAWDFMNTSYQKRKNAKKFGVFSVNVTKDSTGKLSLEIAVYDTDEFTDHVMRSVYKELTERRAKICWADVEELNLYPIFLTSLDLHSLLLTNVFQHKKQMILLEQTSYEDNNQRSTESILVLKGSLTAEDLAGDSTLANWPCRILKELTDISKKHLAQARLSCKLHGCYFDRQTFSVGFYASLETPAGAFELNDFLMTDSFQDNFAFTTLTLKKELLEEYLDNVKLSAAEYFTIEEIASRNEVEIFRYSQHLNTLEPQRLQEAEEASIPS